MNDELTLCYEAKLRDLRARLKKWESDWATAHGGSKPGRQDIKDNPDIAGNYKEYNKVRDILAGKVPPPPPPKDTESDQKKRPAEPAQSETPLKRTKHSETPRRDRARDDELMNTPGISRKLFSPAKVTSLGPTPQKDGRVLGLFDLLLERDLGTPSKDKDRQEAMKKSADRHNIHATPSKRTSLASQDGDSRPGQTPTSASKRRALDVTTPLKNRGEPSWGRTPTSASRLQFDTPAFLKRHSLPTLDENAAFDAPALLKLPRKPFARGLSEIVASLRRVEEEKLDDDLEALREAEDEQEGMATTKRLSSTNADAASHPRQPHPGGLDDEAMYDSPVEDALDRNGKPLPVYKKKAPKRTTRRVNIKPTRVKRPADIELGNETSGGAQSQIQQSETAELDANSEEDDNQSNHLTGATKTREKEGTVKKAVRKVNELAHANFQRLKLRNKGSKGGPGYNSKFRRRR